MNEMIISAPFLEFQKAYTSACENMQTASRLAYQLYNEYGKEFRETCIDQLLISESTFSKMLKAGELMATNPEQGLEQIPYSNLYLLKDVQGEIPAFKEYILKEKLDTLDSMTQREIKKAVKDFWFEHDDKKKVKQPKIVVNTEDAHTKVSCPNLWDQLEDAILNMIPLNQIMDLFYELRKEVTGE